MILINHYEADNVGLLSLFEHKVHFCQISHTKKALSVFRWAARLSYDSPSVTFHYTAGETVDGNKFSMMNTFTHSLRLVKDFWYITDKPHKNTKVGSGSAEFPPFPSLWFVDSYRTIPYKSPIILISDMSLWFIIGPPSMIESIPDALSRVNEIIAILPQRWINYAVVEYRAWLRDCSL